MKKFLRTAAAILLICAALLVCSACTKLQDLIKKKEQEARRKTEFQDSYIEAALLPAQR